MEKHRSIVRGQFTKKANVLENLLMAEKSSSTEIEIKATFKGLLEIKERLSKLDEDIKNKLLPDGDKNELEKEFDDVDQYNSRWLLIVEKYNFASKENSKTEDTVDKHTIHIRLPKIEIIKFDGNIKNWLPFWGQFRKIHENDNMDTEDKFAYLLQSVTPNTEARNLVESYPISADNYIKCIDHLKSRYAREDLLIQLYVRELLALILQRADGDELDLATLYDKVSAHLRALETLGVTKDHAAFILPMVESALPQELLKTWQRTGAHDKKMEDELGNLLKFLQKEVECDQRIKIARSTFSQEAPENKKNNVSPSTAQCLASTYKQKDFIKKAICIWCDKDNHSSLECFKLTQLTVEQRKDILYKKKACTVCLRKGHTYKTCKAYNIKCLICARRHSTTVCNALNLPKKVENTKDVTTTTASSTLDVPKTYTTLLQTVVVQLEYNGKKLPIRALFDSGSQRSYIKKEIIEELQIPEVTEEILTHSLFGGTETKSKIHKLYNLNISSLNNSFSTDLLALGQDVICKNVPRFKSNNVLKQVLKGNQISLTDQHHYSNEIALLIGADYLGFYLTGEVKQLQQNGLVAINTKFGWTLQGKQVSANFNHITSLFISCNDNMDLTDYWSLEMMGIQDPAETKSKEEKASEVMAYFQENIKCSEDGRYEVKLPFNMAHEDLLPNYERAKQRLHSTTNKLMSSGKFQEYHECFQEWHSLGIIEKVSPIDVERDTGHYLPHRAVIKESSLTCTLRPVFDASTKDKNGLSLNSCLEKGNNFISLIPNLLTSFRTGAIGITADSQKAFLQISLPPDDRNYLKFLWWENDSLQDIIIYRHCRVVFGLTSSPFLLSATLLHHLNNIKGELEETASLLGQSWYVDNCITSLDTEEEAHKFITESKAIMQKARFNLRMWVTSPMKINESGKEVILVLGLNWDTVSDKLYCNTTNLPELKDLGTITKRALLSLIQRIFDPIGYTAPVMLTPKLILQATWQLQLQWDDELPSDLLHNFREWYKYINYLNDCRIPRRLTADQLPKCKLSIHMFCDASKDGYGAGVLLRAEKDCKVSVQLITARSRVTPPKKISIPRLELLAALMGSRLLAQVKQNNNLKDCTVYCWTDSSVVLTWIKQELPLNNFVGNRIKEIRQHTNIEQWHHIPGTENWADVASRGCSAKALLDSQWWQGPAWLYQSSDLWPHSEVVVDKRQVHIECKKTTVNAQICTNADMLNYIKAYFSKYTKLIRMVAWMLRFIYNTKNRNNKRTSELQYSEFERAEKVIIKLIQEENKENLKKDSGKLIHFHDEEGILRIKTKLTLSSEFPESTKIPYLLPAKNLIVAMLVRQRHEQLQHAGANQLIVDLRTRFWIIGVRRLVKSVISKCVICNRYRSKPVQAPTAPLPPERITCSTPFQTTGIDLAGPLYLRNGEKCWIVLYTCAVYRAVHLELTRLLSTEAFIMTLRRFIARRGRAILIMSDHGTNFQGTKNLLSSLDWEEVQRYSTIHRISWKMNAPTAAWWGGYWERLIGIMKNLLKRVIGNALLTYDELETVLCDCEAVMNGCPLTYINQDKGDCLEPLTPARFIQPISNTDVTDLDQIDANNLNKRLQYLQTIRNQFRHRFKTEYLTLLVQKGKENKDNLNIGDVVLIETDEKRIKWPLGIVEKLFTGKDGVERTAQVKTSTGMKVRPVQRLYKLEVTTDQSGNDFPLLLDLPPSDSVKSTAEDDPLTETMSSEQNVRPGQSTRSGRKVKMPSKFDIYV